ncbi:uncharacterized protein LOC117566504 [Drosophila albomicans]|uniref:Uncharacterized protein LOC117566504 n=1 Tax=Drosophila albomicans TaxID=7291 RepID=A0A6P8WE72_DROAB|nr:uncharacterized protein LOC117566504 [Drosophila albomicans]
MAYRLIVIAIAILSFQSLNEAKRPFTIEINNFTCRTLDPSWGHEFSCIIYRKRIVPVMYARFSLKETANDFNLWLDVGILKKDKTKISIGRHKLDGCKFLESFYSNNIFGKFFKRILSVSNFPKGCPVPANTVFEIRNYTVLVDEYPPNVPALTHQLTLQIEKDNKIIADVYVEGSIIY